MTRDETRPGYSQYSFAPIILKLEEEGFINYETANYYEKTIQVNNEQCLISMNMFKATDMIDLTIRNIPKKRNRIQIIACSLPSSHLENLITSAIAIYIYFKNIVVDDSEFSFCIGYIKHNENIIHNIHNIHINGKLNHSRLGGNIRKLSDKPINFYFYHEEEFDKSTIYGIQNTEYNPTNILPVRIDKILDGKTIRPIIF